MTSLCSRLHTIISDAEVAKASAEKIVYEFLKGTKTKEEVNASVSACMKLVIKYKNIRNKFVLEKGILLRKSEYQALNKLALLNEIEVEDITSRISQENLHPKTHRLVKLDLHRLGLIKLGGTLDGLISLKELWLNNNTFSSTEDLSSLTQLNTLLLDECEVESVEGLASLTKLTTLFLNGNSLTSIDALASLTKLRRLMLSNNSISSITALGSLANLESLDIYGNNELSDRKILLLRRLLPGTEINA